MKDKNNTLSEADIQVENFNIINDTVLDSSDSETDQSDFDN